MIVGILYLLDNLQNVNLHLVSFTMKCNFLSCASFLPGLESVGSEDQLTVIEQRTSEAISGLFYWLSTAKVQLG